MALNSLPAAATLRQPRGIVQLGPYGALTAVPGWISWSVDNNLYQEADTFRIVYGVKALPASNNANWFLDQTEIFAQIFAGFPRDPANPQTAELMPVIYGRVDDIRYDLVQGSITLTGRDLTAVFIDNRISDSYLNQRAFQIATQLAESHGLDTDNISPTTAIIGPSASGSQTGLSSNRSEWDLLCYLARTSGYVVFVSGQSLYFGPDPATSADHYIIQWGRHRQAIQEVPLPT
jgi:hypothetical protein